MRETVYPAVAVMVTGTTVPTVQTCVGTELDGTERQDGTGERMSVFSCSHKGVDILGLSARHHHNSKQHQEKGVFFHILLGFYFFFSAL